MATALEIAHEWFEEVWNKGDEAAIARLMAGVWPFSSLVM